MATVEPYDTKGGRRYRVIYRTPERKQTSKRGFRTKRDAELFLASVEVSKARGEFIDAGAARVTIGQLGPDWLRRQSHLKPSSYRPVEAAWRNHVLPEWGGTPVSEIRKTAVQQWVSGLTTGEEEAMPPRKPKSATVVIRAYGILAAILDGAVDDRRVLSNPARGVVLPRKGKKAHVYLSHAQVHLLAEESKHETLVLTLAYCGLRWGEAVGLRVRHLDMLKRRIRVEENAVEVGGRVEVGTPKNHKRRTVPFPRFLAEPLARQCEGKGRDDLVFPGEDGGYLRSTRVQEDRGGWFSGAVKRAGIPRITPHDLRHSAASFAVSAGANVKAVQRMLGHSSAAMTLDIYADLFDADLDAVADALDHAVSAAGVAKRLPLA
ncbi:site-specific integrase [Arthrobacter agilis]|nr:tyrosine-type recombinase/integrase [Arthrobacter agilis]OUM42893.1 site-specific integrase [Arthrobacter agilis]PPB45838.1 site-specific integrase [Arthrobacter agilis]TPV25381.1 site-specific integrase [Arthrobacter agilis]VDR33113.1 Integrase [Arthrobacter agilis]